MLSAILISFLLIQTCQSQTEVVDKNETEILRQIIIKKSEEAFEELIRPLLTEVTRLNTTLEYIRKQIEIKKTQKQEFLILNQLAVNKNKINEEDQCKNLTDYLPKAQDLVEKAFYMSTDFTGDLAGLLVDSLNCLDINVFKAITCLLNNIHEIKDIYAKYKPEINPMLAEMKQMFITLFELYQECIHEL